MRRFSRRVLVGLAALTLSGRVLAEQSGSDAPQQRDAQQSQGRIQSIDRKQHTITLIESGKTFRVGPSTGVYKNNGFGTLDEIHPGDRVVAIYHAPAGGQDDPIPTLDQLKAWSSSPGGGTRNR
jgi:hypothetical protein